MSFQQEIEVCIRSRCTLICVVSSEEERILDGILEVCQKSHRSLYLWDHADFFQTLLGPHGSAPTAKDPLTVLEAIEKMEGDSVYVLRDYHQCWQNQPRILRKMRTLAQKLKYTKKTLIVTPPVSKIPDELRDEAVVVECGPPGLAELDNILSRLTRSPGVKVNLTPEDREKILGAALGLSSNQAQRVFAKAIVCGGVLDKRDVDLIIGEKKQIIRESGALEFIEPTHTIADVGGLEALKEWLRMRERAFGRTARAYGLPEPKGIGLIGIPGTGKSLTAKTIASLWHLPLIRLDVGALFGSLVGEFRGHLT